MQLRLPLWYILVLLWAFLLKGRAAPESQYGRAHRGLPLSNDDDDSDSDSDSDDDDDDSNSNSQHHRNGCPTIGSGEQSSLSKGAVAGIVIGILLLLLLLILLACWMQRRRRRSRSRQGIEVTMTTITPPPPAKEHSSSRSNSAHPPTLRPQSMIAQHLSNTAPGGVIFSDSMGRHQTRELNNIPRTAAESTESVALPNPYEQDTPPMLPPRDDSVTSPASTMSRYASLYSTTSGPTEETHSHTRSYSAAPSAWTHDDSTAPLLSRGTTQASRLTASSSLHEEMAGYQKALEAHHRKEQDDAQQRESRIGQGSAVPEDPPPVYRDREELL